MSEVLARLREAERERDEAAKRMDELLAELGMRVEMPDGLLNDGPISFNNDGPYLSLDELLAELGHAR